MMLIFTAALACSPPYQEPHELDAAEQSADTTPPEAIPLLTYDVKRGVGPRRSGCGGSTMVTSCDDLGQVQLSLTAPLDDRTPAESIGYEITVVSGDAPFHLEGAMRAQNGVIWLSWGDGSTDDQEALDFTLSVTPIDLAGNRGPASQVRIEDGGGFLAIEPALLLALLVLRRPRPLRLAQRHAVG